MRSVESGMTLVEVTVTIVIIGILAAIAVPRMIDRGSFDSRAFYDRALSVVRQAQKAAIARRASGGPVLVCVTATSITAGRGANCATPLPNPAGSGSLAFTAPSGVTLSPVGNFSFDALGQPSAGVTITLNSTIPGDPKRQIIVSAVTGYVQHVP